MNSTLFPDNNMIWGNNVDKLQQELNVSNTLMKERVLTVNEKISEVIVL